MSECNHHHKCIKEAQQQARAICSKRGARFTDLREHVFELVWQSHEPVKAYDILEKLKKEGLNAQPPTVYRALEFLQEYGLIHKLHRLNAYVGCGHLNERKPCFFLICRSCGTVTEEADEHYRKLISEASRKHDFVTEGVSFEVEGLCSACH